VLFRSRSQWLARGPDAPKDARYKGVYRWLLRHDREWLRANSPSKEKTVGHSAPTQTSKSGWRLSPNRDAHVSESVRTVAEKLRQEQGYPKQVSKRKICREIPELRWLPTPTKAPLTALALEEVGESVEDFALRRIRWTLQHYLEEGICPKRYAFTEMAHLKGNVFTRKQIQSALDEAMAILSSLK